MMDASIIIPAFNEEKNIASVVKRVRKLSKKYEIIVVDDGSRDTTSKIAAAAGARVITLKKNHGKAFSCITGARAASSEKIIFIDADLQLLPEEIPKFVRALDKCELAAGVRDMSEVPIQRRASNWLAARLIGGKDALCGFRGVRKNALLKMDIRSKRYEFEAEMLLAAKKRGYKIIEIPVSVRYENFSGMGISDSLRVLWFIVKKRLSI